jgi:mycothiol system anti-sigma-R factor
MSCGKPHETPCSDVLGRVFEFLDNELADADCAKIRQHLEECGPCLEEYGLDRAVKEAIHRACGCEAAPQDLRSRVMYRIQQVRMEISRIETTEF